MKKFLALIGAIGLAAFAQAGNQASVTHNGVTTQYENIYIAITNAVSGDTVTLLEDINLDGPDSAIVIDSKDLVINGDNHSITQSYWNTGAAYIRSLVGDQIFRVKGTSTVVFNDLYVTTMLGGQNQGSMSPLFECLVGTHTTFNRVTSRSSRFIDIYGEAVLNEVDLRAHPHDIASSVPDGVFRFYGGTLTINSGRIDGSFYGEKLKPNSVCNINGGTFYGMSAAGGDAHFDYVTFNIVNEAALFNDDALDTSRNFLTKAKSLKQEVNESSTPGFLWLGPRVTIWYDVSVTADNAIFYTNGVALAAGNYSFPDDVYYTFEVDAEAGYEAPTMTIAPSAYTNVTEVTKFVVQTNLAISVSAVKTDNNFSVTISGTTTYYTTFAQAVAAAKAGGVTEIKVNNAAAVVAGALPADASGMTLDLNGFSVSPSALTIASGQTFAIIGSTSGSTLGGSITVNGEIDLTGLNATTTFASGAAVVANASGKIIAPTTVNGATVTDPNTVSAFATAEDDARMELGSSRYTYSENQWVLDTNNVRVTASDGTLIGNYATLADAVAVASLPANKNSTATLLASMEITSTITSPTQSKDNQSAFTIDGNGFTLTANSVQPFIIGGRVVQTFTNVKLIVDQKSPMTLNYGSQVILNNCDFNSTYALTVSSGTGNTAKPSVTINGGSYVSSATFLQLNNSYRASAVINGGYFYGAFTHSCALGVLTINAGTFDNFSHSGFTSTKTVCANGTKFRKGSTDLTSTLNGFKQSTQVVVGPDSDNYYRLEPAYPTVTVDADDGATLLTNGTEAVTVDSFQVANGASLGVVSASTTTGYNTEVSVDGVSVKGQTLTITSNTTIRVELIKPTWTVTVEEDNAALYTNGVEITESSIEVKKGEAIDYTAAADSGYKDPRITIPGRYTSVSSIDDFVVNSNMTIYVSARAASGDYVVVYDDDEYFFDTYADAVAFAKTKSITTIMLGKNVDLDSAITLENGYTLDLNGYTFYVGDDDDGYFTVPNGVSYTVTDSAGGGYLRGWPVVAVGGTLDISALKARIESAVVNGTLVAGTSVTPNKLKQEGAVVSSTDGATFTSSIGTYTYSTSSEIWTVAGEVARATDGTGLTDSFNKLLLAVDFAETNTTVLVTADNTLAKGIVIDKENLTINGQGYTVTATGVDVAFSVTASTATFQNLTVNATGKTAIYAYAADVVINNSTYTGATVLKTAEEGTITVTAGTFSGEIEGDGFVINGGTFNDFTVAEGAEATIANGGAIFDSDTELKKVKKVNQKVVAASTSGYYTLDAAPLVTVTVTEDPAGSATLYTNDAAVATSSFQVYEGETVKLQSVANSGYESPTLEVDDVAVDNPTNYTIEAAITVTVGAELSAFEITIVKSSGIGAVTTNNVAVDFGSGSSVTALVAKQANLTFGLTETGIIIPAFKVQIDDGTAVCTNKTFTYQVTEDGKTLTFTATAAGSDEDITQDEAKRAIKEAITLTGAEKTTVEGKVDALCATNSSSAKGVATWIEAANGGITSTAMLNSDYTKASMHLNLTSIIPNGSTLTTEQVTSSGCISTQYKIGTTVLLLGTSSVTKNYVKVSVSEGEPLQWTPWGSVSAALQAIVGIGDDGKITLTPATGNDFVYAKVVLPAD